VNSVDINEILKLNLSTEVRKENMQKQEQK